MCREAGWCKCKTSWAYHPDNLRKNLPKFKKRRSDLKKAQKREKTKSQKMNQQVQELKKKAKLDEARQRNVLSDSNSDDEEEEDEV